MNIEEIVEKYLAENGYDGLYNNVGECGCEAGDLCPCENPNPDCRAGYKVPCTCGEDCRWHIAAEKPCAQNGGKPDSKPVSSG